MIHSSDGVRPFMPPCSLVSLFAFTNISYLCLPSTMFGISSIARNSFFTILLYASIPIKISILTYY